MSIPEQLLLAAHKLTKEGQDPFSLEALVVMAWKADPKVFGLPGYCDLYPNANKVISALSGKKGLVKRGLLTKLAAKLYGLSKKGQQAVAKLTYVEEQLPPRSPPQFLSTTDELRFRKYLNSKVVAKWQEGRREEITFDDACSFWQVSLTLNRPGEGFASAFLQLQEDLGQMQALFNQGVVEFRNGQVIQHEDVDLLQDIHKFLKQRFDRHLAFMYNRNKSPLSQSV